MAAMTPDEITGDLRGRRRRQRGMAADISFVEAYDKETATVRLKDGDTSSPTARSPGPRSIWVGSGSSRPLT
jgi:hypothetical protein